MKHFSVWHNANKAEVKTDDSKAEKEKVSEVEVVEIGAVAIDHVSSLLEVDHQFLRKYLAENNCTDEFLPELHSSGVLDMMPELSKVIRIFRSIIVTSCS